LVLAVHAFRAERATRATCFPSLCQTAPHSHLLHRAAHILPLLTCPAALPFQLCRPQNVANHACVHCALRFHSAECLSSTRESSHAFMPYSGFSAFFTPSLLSVPECQLCTPTPTQIVHFDVCDNSHDFSDSGPASLGQLTIITIITMTMIIIINAIVAGSTASWTVCTLYAMHRGTFTGHMQPSQAHIPKPSQALKL